MGHCVSKRSGQVLEVGNGDIPTTDVKKLLAWARSDDPAAQCKAARAIARLAEIDENQVLIVDKGASLCFALSAAFLRRPSSTQVGRGARSRLDSASP